MDKKIFAVLLLGILLVTPFASAGFGEWVSNVFGTQTVEKNDIIIGPIVPQPKGGSSGGGSEPTPITEDPIPGTEGPIAVVYHGIVKTHKILAEGEKIYIGENGYIEMSGVNGQGSEEHCLITVLEPHQDNGNSGSAGVALIKVGELRVLNRENFDLIIGVTALTQEPDYCAIVVRYEEFLETEPEQPIPVEEDPTPETDRDNSETHQAPIN